MPPAGAFGASTGIQDVYNLAWKPALVHHGLTRWSDTRRRSRTPSAPAWTVPVRPTPWRGRRAVHVGDAQVVNPRSRHHRRVPGHRSDRVRGAARRTTGRAWPILTTRTGSPRRRHPARPGGGPAPPTELLACVFVRPAPFLDLHAVVSPGRWMPATGEGECGCPWRPGRTWLRVQPRPRSGGRP
ncbi:FAD-dependent monooxygenase [Saccharothrix carnea]|uniref:FAD-dependent monooxygenase n=1 Tax=Saccharothrix carnea TaxID=1280637 RepID=UPI000D0D82D7